MSINPRAVTGFHDLTPVDEVQNVAGFNSMLFKRDDLYLPFEDEPRLGGGKVRQTFALFNELKEELSQHNGIITYSSVSSPQSVIVVKTAQSMGYHSAVAIGTSATIEKTALKHRPIQECIDLGADILNVTKLGYNNVLLAKTKVIAEEQNYFIVHFGINIDDKPHALVDSIADQVQNIPDELDALIIPVGSGIQTGAILHGLHKYNKKVGKILAVQIAGYDRTKTVHSILESLGTPIPEWEQVIDNTYPYSKHLKYRVFDENTRFDLNVVYESKALQYVERHQSELGLKSTDKILYWVVGENNYLYT